PLPAVLALVRRLNESARHIELSKGRDCTVEGGVRPINSRIKMPDQDALARNACRPQTRNVQPLDPPGVHRLGLGRARGNRLDETELRCGNNRANTTISSQRACTRTI